ncbi:MAG: TIGR02285 family protein [Magnetococcales bacterium]|nr:TIGR02285 family protein [Magnetococcales bacterium]
MQKKVKYFEWSYAFIAVLTILAYLLNPGISNSEAKKPILWLHPDFPPIYIVKGPGAGSGLGDKVSKYIFKNLPDYRHTQKVSNFKRIIKTISAGKNVCSMVLLKNSDREKVVAYSEQILASPQNAIITSKRLLPLFSPLSNSHGAISLKELLQQSDLILGYSLGRSYSSEVDKTIRKYANSKNSVVTSGVNIFEGVMKMLKFRRIDYTIGYAYEGEYMARHLGFKEEIISIPLQEHPSLVPVYVGCPKTEWGYTILAKLNPIILSLRLNPDFYGIYKEWMDSSAWVRYENMITEHFKPKTAQ